ncbi:MULTISPECIES: FUSC family protein [unclassified Streptomyces]|uniref:FUSC family protein n=1 Tax=unclassified Streptomyces TaxID=2593676 RepID=UPI002E37ADEF|nr:MULTISPECIES: FUSC family protein [unclassified Streptomyces]WUC65896.1 FUSC family protein [Streptomyces sp. NBC_00539]
MGWLRALQDTARSGMKVERARSEPLVAVRAAVGLAIVIGAGLALLGPGAAASSAFGAFTAAIATLQQSWRPRPALALVSGLTLAVSTFVGYLVGSRDTLAFLALLAVWTFLTGLLWAAGATAGIIASGNVAIMLVTVTLPTSVAQAAGHAAMIAAGGVVQALLIVLFPVRRWGAQRDALADALAAEADYARRLRRDPLAPFDPQPLMKARDAATVTVRQARRRPAELHGARGLAERIRPVLASLADPAVGAPAEGSARERVSELLAAAGAVLDAAARAIRHGEPVRLPAPSLAVLKAPDQGDLLQGAPLRAARRLTALLDDVLETADPGSGRTADPGAAMLRPALPALVPPVVKAVRGELRSGSPVLRHALRVTAVVCAGYAVGLALPFGHGYWAPMASVMVMRPDFTQTWSRAVARFGGTLVGVSVATATVRLAQPGMYLSGLLAVLSAGLMYALMRTGYVVAQACVSAYVVFLLGMGGLRWDQTVPDRVALTLVGGVLAMAGYAFYPAWETPRLRTRLADWLAAGGRYAHAVLARYADPGGVRPEDVRRALLATRDARIAWQEALGRAEGEPVRHRGLSRAAADGAADAVAALGRAVMLLEAHIPDRAHDPVPGAAELAAAVRADTEAGARAVRERRAPQWGGVRAVLADPGWEARDPGVLRAAAQHVLEALEELSQALIP